MVKSIEIKKASVRNRLIVDVDVWMNHPDDFDFSPRASVDGNNLSIRNEGDEGTGRWYVVDTDEMVVDGGDRMVEVRVK